MVTTLLTASGLANTIVALCWCPPVASREGMLVGLITWPPTGLKPAVTGVRKSAEKGLSEGIWGPGAAAIYQQLGNIPMF